MLNKIIKFSLDNRLFVLLVTILLVVYGVKSTLEMDVDVFPDLNAPTVVVLTESNDLAAEEVERLVSFPIETAMNGASDVRRVRSSSLQGLPWPLRIPPCCPPAWLSLPRSPPAVP